MSDKRMKAGKELDAEKLLKLLCEATRGPWRVDRGLMGDDLWITAPEREGYGVRSRKDGDGPICHVSTERHHFESDEDRFGNHQDIRKSWKTPILKAAKDAELIVEAVNALPELLRRLKLDVDETAWLIEWPADRHGPTRYYSVGEAPVIDANHATRFARKEDAEAMLHRGELKGATRHGAKVCEHLWFAPKKQKAAA